MRALNQGSRQRPSYIRDGARQPYSSAMLANALAPPKPGFKAIPKFDGQRGTVAAPEAINNS